MPQGPNQPYSQIDGNHILQRVFDEVNDKLRVDATVTAEITGDVQVEIDAADGDNILIVGTEDGTASGIQHIFRISPTGAIYVNGIYDSTANPVPSNVGLVVQDRNASSSIVRQTFQLTGKRGSVDNTQVSLDVSVHDIDGNGITSSFNNSNRQLHTQTPDALSIVGSFAALNDAVSLVTSGLSSVGFQVNAGTFIGTLQAQSSVDNGINWTNVPFYDPQNAAILTELKFTSSNILRILAVVPLGGSSHIRIVVTNYISGSTTGLIRASRITGATGIAVSSVFNKVTNSSAAISSNTATLILPENLNRKYASISNNSASVVNIQFASSSGLSTVQGLRIPSNSFYELKGDNLFTGDVYGYCGSNIMVSVSEGTP